MLVVLYFCPCAALSIFSLVIVKNKYCLEYLMRLQIASIYSDRRMLADIPFMELIGPVCHRSRRSRSITSFECVIFIKNLRSNRKYNP